MPHFLPRTLSLAGKPHVSTCRPIATVAGMWAPGASVAAETCLSKFVAPPPEIADADSSAALIWPRICVRDQPSVSVDVDVTAESHGSHLVAVAIAPRE